MKKLALVAVFALGLFGLCASAAAADKDDPTGTWKVKTKFGEKEIEQTIKLENKDGKVTGTVNNGKEDTKIEDGKFKDGEVTFSVTRARKDVKLVTKYTAKVTGDAIKGTVALDYNGKEIKSDFEGKREK